MYEGIWAGGPFDGLSVGGPRGKHLRRLPQRFAEVGFASFAAEIGQHDAYFVRGFFDLVAVRLETRHRGNRVYGESDPPLEVVLGEVDSARVQGHQLGEATRQGFEFCLICGAVHVMALVDDLPLRDDGFDVT